MRTTAPGDFDEISGDIGDQPDGLFRNSSSAHRRALPR
jgi:hypothetical protein